MKSFDAAIKYSNEVFCVPLKEKGNIVVSAAPYPMDVDLYQSQKALENGRLAVEDGGVIILVSKCRTGVGEKTFLDLLSKAGSYQEVFEILDREYKLGYHKAARMAQIGMKVETWAVTDLEDEVVEKAMLKPFPSVQTAVDEAVKIVKEKGKKPRIVVMPHGSLTVPYTHGGG
ncbi:MAG TPA: hypothetical protein ENI45_02750 [Thermoplasmatales archaeon]|nr:hypothetical protein [Thermoplasmatales archaeon]